MRKTLVFVVVAIMLAGVVFAISSSDFTSSFHYQEISLKQIFLGILDFFRGGVTGFVGYSPGASTNLTIWDDTDTITKYVDEQVYFYANFTNGTAPLGSPVANVSICINFTQPLCGNMSYNSTSKLWQFNTTSFNSGIFNWSANATSAVENLFANDTAAINNSCLNASALAGDYYLKTSRVVCSGSHYLNFSIGIVNISSIDLNCNGSILVVNKSSAGIVLSNSSNLSLRNCKFQNSENALTIIRGSAIGNSTIAGLEFTNVNAIGINLTSSQNVYISNCSFNNSGNSPLIFENVSYSSVSDCLMFNSSKADLNVRNSRHVNITNITSNFNRDDIVAVVIGGSNFTRVRNLRVYNALSIFGFTFGSLSDFYLKGFDNYLADSYFENISNPNTGNASQEFVANNSISTTLGSGIENGIGFGAANEFGLAVNNVAVSNEGICGGDIFSSNSSYTNLRLSNCKFFGFGVAYADSIIAVADKKVTLENLSINNSGIALGFYGSGASLSSLSSVRNINIYNSTYAVAAEGINLFDALRNINAFNTSTAVYGINSSANVLNSVFRQSSAAKLQNGTEVTFVNVTLDKSQSNLIDDTSLLHVKWAFNVLVQDSLSVLIENANVTLRNSSSVVFSELTNAYGNIQWKNVTEYDEDFSGKTYQNYNLTVFTEALVQATLDPKINESKMLNITLLGNASLLVYSPVSGRYYNNPVINLSYAVLFNSTDKCWFINTTGSRVNLTGCANTTFGAKEGSNNITLFANDTLGNITYSKIFFTLDTVFPNITLFNITLVTNTSVLLNWTTSEEANMSFMYGTSPSLSSGSAHNATFANTSTYLLSGLSMLTSYNFNATFCDRANNCAIKSGTFRSGGNFSPPNLHIPEAEIIVQELVASELTATPQKTSLTPGSKYIFTLDGERHEVKLKQVYMAEKALFEFSSDPISKEIANGSTGEVDLDGDGVDDIALTVNNIELTKVTFDLKRISFKKEEKVAAGGEEKPAVVAQPVEEKIPPEIAKPKSFMEKYGLYLLISLVAIIAVVVTGGAILLQKKRPVFFEIERKKELQIPKASHLENIMKIVYGMLKDNKTELDVSKYLEEMNLEENVIKSIVFEMKAKNNRMDQIIKFARQEFSKGKSVEEVREILESAGWAKNLVQLATEE
jgi:hypothetical protein